MNVRFRQSQLTRLRFDADAAERQVSDFRALGGDAGLRQRAVDQLIARRAELADETGRSATRVAVRQLPVTGGGIALAAAGELLVAGTGREAAALLLERRGFAVADTAGPVTRMVRRNASAAEVLAVTAALRDLGVVAGPNYVTAVAPVIKGMLGLASPRPAAVGPGDRPASDTRGAGVRVAVIDTGIDPAAVDASHGWLAGVQVDDRADGNTDLLDAVPAPDGLLDEAAGHGTFVAGVVRQMAPACEVTAIKAMDSDGVGTEFSVAEALMRLADNENAPDLVNLSVACLAEEQIAPIAIDAAIDALITRHPDTLVVAAAGNDASASPTWPAAGKAVLSVAARDGGQAAAYSNTGYWVDFSVPADGIVSTYVQGVREIGAGGSGSPERIEYGGPFAAWSGTSFAAPQVAGLLAALRSEGLSSQQAVARLKRNSVKANDIGWMVDAEAAAGS